MSQTCDQKRFTISALFIVMNINDFVSVSCISAMYSWPVFIVEQHYIKYVTFLPVMNINDFAFVSCIAAMYCWPVMNINNLAGAMYCWSVQVSRLPAAKERYS